MARARVQGRGAQRGGGAAVTERVAEAAAVVEAAAARLPFAGSIRRVRVWRGHVEAWIYGATTVVIVTFDPAELLDDPHPSTAVAIRLREAREELREPPPWVRAEKTTRRQPPTGDPARFTGCRECGWLGFDVFNECELQACDACEAFADDDAALEAARAAGAPVDADGTANPWAFDAWAGGRGVAATTTLAELEAALRAEGLEVRTAALHPDAWRVVLGSKRRSVRVAGEWRAEASATGHALHVALEAALEVWRRDGAAWEHGQ